VSLDELRKIFFSHLTLKNTSSDKKIIFKNGPYIYFFITLTLYEFKREKNNSIIIFIKLSQGDLIRDGGIIQKVFKKKKNKYLQKKSTIFLST